MRLSKLYDKIKEDKQEARDNLDKMGEEFTDVLKRENNEEFEAGFIAACKIIQRHMEESYPALKEE